MLERITPVILTLNEQPNIERALEALRWAGRVLVVDSGSTDATHVIAEGFPNVVMIERSFDSHSAQWNFATQHPLVETEWVLALDADYVLSEGLIAELGRLSPPLEVSGYRAAFTYCIDGKPLRGSLYPASVVLFRKSRGHYLQDGHTQRLEVEGEIRPLEGRILHDDRKPLGRWFRQQRAYAALEASKIRESQWRDLSWPDRIRKLRVLAPPVALAYVLFVKGTILDGPRGIEYAVQRFLAESALSLALLRPSSRSAVRQA